MEKRTVRPFSRLFWQVKKLYEDSFPKVERVSLIWMIMMVYLGQADCVAYFSEEKFCGFTYCLKSDEAYYLLFLAVKAQEHSKGYGSQILRAIRREAGQVPIYLVIEPLEEEAENITDRKRRLSFYQRNGFILTDTLYYENQECYQVMVSQPREKLAAFERLAKKIQWSGMRIRVEKNLQKSKANP